MRRVLQVASAADEEVARSLNRLARSHPVLRTGTTVCARWLSFGEIGLMLLLGVSGRRRAASRMLLSVGIVFVACEIGGIVWQRRRPFERLAGVESLVEHTGGRSFPSRHVASGLAMAAIGGGAHPRMGAIMQAIAWLLGLSRVMAGLHYPSDVLSAVPLAGATEFVVTRGAGRRRRRW